jgi:hypothetical protein
MNDYATGDRPADFAEALAYERGSAVGGLMGLTALVLTALATFWAIATQAPTRADVRATGAAPLESVQLRGR